MFHFPYLRIVFFISLFWTGNSSSILIRPLSNPSSLPLKRDLDFSFPEAVPVRATREIFNNFTPLNIAPAKTHLKNAEQTSVLNFRKDLSTFEGVFDPVVVPGASHRLEGYNYIQETPEFQYTDGNNGNLHNNDYAITVTETRHLTSYITRSVTETTFKYRTQFSTQFVPTYVPTYVTNYVTSYATAYVTKNFPVYHTNYVTEYHTELHTITESHTDLRTVTKTQYVTDYVTQTAYVTEVVYLTHTHSKTVTSHHKIPVTTTATHYESIYFTSTLQVPYEVTSTVWQPHYVTKYVTVSPSKNTVNGGSTYYPYGKQVVTHTKPIYPSANR